MAFLKHNLTKYPDALLREAQGLDYLRQYTPSQWLRVVEVFTVDKSVLSITAVDVVSPNTLHWEKLGKGLAGLHQTKQAFYGLGENNYIGLNPQLNTASDDWGDFFVNQRLRYQIDLVKNAALRHKFLNRLDMCVEKLVFFLNTYCQYPSLVHGDLWLGNVLCDGHDDVWLIDPAVYYADREVDIAMTEMFGGFDPLFYTSYQKILPISPEYSTKKEIYNLYHYLNHLNLFGESYLAGCEQGMAVIEAL